MITPGEWKYGIRWDGTMWLSLGDSKNGPHYQGDLVASTEDADLIIQAPTLAFALKECADDLEAELAKDYTAEMRVYPCIEADYQRDMRPVIAARAALAKAGL